MPNQSQFKNNKQYRTWYKKYREKNREKIRTYNREYSRKIRLNNKKVMHS